MQRLLRLALLLSALALLPALDAVAQNAKKKAKPAATDPADKPAFDETKVRTTLLNGTYILGKLTVTDADKKEFTLTVTHQVKTPNPDGQKKLAQLRQQYQQALQRRDKNKADKISAEAGGISPYNVDEYPVAFECQGETKLIVRTLVKPTDENGKPKKLSAAEERKLKGDDPKLLGYTATVKDLEDGMLVRVYIDKAKLKEAKAAKKDDKSAKDDKDAKSAKDDKDAKKDDKEADKMIYPITMIVIVPPPAERTGALGGGGGANPFLKGK